MIDEVSYFEKKRPLRPTRSLPRSGNTDTGHGFVDATWTESIGPFVLDHSDSAFRTGILGNVQRVCDQSAEA